MAEKLFKEVVGENETKTYEEVPVFQTFTNEEEFNKFTQSLSSKAKGEILKEFGVNSVGEIKSLIDSTQENNAFKLKYEELNTKYKELEPKYSELESNYAQAKEEIVLSRFQIPDEIKGDFLTLARAGVKDGVTFEDSAKLVSERLNFDKGVHRISIGGKKTDPITNEEKMKQLTKL